MSTSDQRTLSSIALVRLEPGRHRSPDDGVCVVELASIIGGERFSDRPDCVCPVIGAFLRSWNDAVGYADRQRLEPYASSVVGTGGYRRISRIRRDICLSHGGADLDRGPLRRAAARLRMRLRIAWVVGIFPSIWLKEGAGAYAARVCFERGGSAEAFMLLDRLLEVGAASSPRSNGNGNGNGNGHRDELAIRAAIIARERARSRAARESGSPIGAAADRPRERPAGPPRVGS
ncbi:MAG TPA: hypothetical protein VKA41_12525 [Solirubrobacterales bacterium]|nr:hypothetical protein [Solirubrobacterales bacterium]